jgi:hypothetical protein
MKILLLVSLFFLGCSKPASPEVKGENQEISLGSEHGIQGSIKIKVVVLDGNEYYATKAHGGWYSLCPKLPPKKAAEAP